ncbi:hypothetical protein I3843_02G107700 [Carya illinoinensis]|uniref:Formin-like protein n=1 Tax=Carya illinoinensis TaxID=32201 RepID=A0A922FUR2_CARIL|nr:hypothetical protein I3760_02G123000 [Carya illinoinensis]KAG6727257.1 hypothetical protein I3842_02G121100 [Carya illinoinensis]KAG7992040.1 hypothetical protein I3843_02G107700 [Carya illinoinensis]
MPTAGVGVAVLLLTLFSTASATTPSNLSRRRHHRHLLHQPFFPPLDSFPPTQPPSSSPYPQPQLQQPKLPFSSSSTPPKPFFPSYPSPPPPPSQTSLATFPANISELLLPHPSPSSISHRHLIAIFVSVSLLIVALFSAISAFFYCRKQAFFTTTTNVADKAPHSDNLRLYPPNIATSDGSYKHPHSGSSNTSSEFLYIGTLANSHGIYDEDTANSSNVGVSATTQYLKLGSPELKPLPPLPRHSFKQRCGSSELGSSENRENDEEGEEEEEFFSPRGSSGRKDSPVRIVSSPQRLFNAENFGSRSFNSRTASYPCSDSASPTNSFFNSASPALNLSTTSLKSKSPDFMVGFPAPVPARPIITSMSSLSSSTSSSSSERGSWNTQNSPTRNSDVSEQSERCPSRTDSVPIKLPPPPPPPPPPRFWEAPASQKQTRDPDPGPPILVTPTGPVLLQNVATEQLQSNGKAQRNEDTPRPKLKPLHWDKVRASSDRAMVWDQLKSSSFQLNEEMIETLFMINNSNNTNMTLKDGGRRVILPSPNLENRVLDPKKSQNIAILLRALDVTIEEVCEALLEGCEELRNSRMFLKLLEAVLKTGNRMNVGTNRGDAHAFKLDTLLKLVDVKGTDGKTTLLHFVVQEIIRAEGSRLSSTIQSELTKKNQQSAFRDDVEFRKLGLQVVSGLSGELTNVKKAATMDSYVLSSEVAKLAGGIMKISEVLKLNEETSLKQTSRKFSESMNGFLKKAEEEILRIQAKEKVALSLVKEITEYFHGNSVKEEAHPFRIFTVVRDFLSVLDGVCKEVGKVNERTIVGSARQFPAPLNPSLPQAFSGFNGRQHYDTSDDENSSSS